MKLATILLLCPLAASVAHAQDYSFRPDSGLPTMQNYLDYRHTAVGTMAPSVYAPPDLRAMLPPTVSIFNDGPTDADRQAQYLHDQQNDFARQVEGH